MLVAVTLPSFAVLPWTITVWPGDRLFSVPIFVTRTVVPVAVLTRTIPPPVVAT